MSVRSLARLAALLAAAWVLGWPLPGSGDDPRAREIMQLVSDRDDGDNAIYDLRMVLTDAVGRKRERAVRLFSKDFGKDTYRLMFFLSPADVRDTGFLTYNYDDQRDDDQWIYLPALRSTKRIASGERSSSFMGSDFTYADLTSRNVDRYDYRLMGEDEVEGDKVWLIESIPRTHEEVEETGYTKSVEFVNQKNHLIVRAVHWVADGDRLKYMDVRQIQQIDGIWVPTEVTMSTREARATVHKTVLDLMNVRFNQDLAKDVFSVRQLEKGTELVFRTGSTR